jgi:hypothetical protein
MEITEHSTYLGFLPPIHQIQIELHIAYFYDTAKDKQSNTGNDCKDGNICGNACKDSPKFRTTI